MIHYKGKLLTFINVYMLKSEASSSTQGICSRSHNPNKNIVKHANRLLDTKCCKYICNLFVLHVQTIKMYGKNQFKSWKTIWFCWWIQASVRLGVYWWTDTGDCKVINHTKVNERHFTVMSYLCRFCAYLKWELRVVCLCLW